jgi:DNA-binding NarL/FixJ family response regulator
MSDSSPVAAVLVETVGTVLPRARVETSDTAIVRGIPEADAVVIDVTVDAEAGLDVLRHLRARGFTGGVVLLAVDASPELREGAARFGARCADREALVSELPTAIAATLAGIAEADTLAQLRHTQKLLAAGEIALRLQHALNNPLAALLAEAQLLELEAPDAERAESASSIVEQARRVIAVVRQLDGIAR